MVHDFFKLKIMDSIKFLHVAHNTSIPIATQLGDQITWLIISGEIKEGDSLPSIRRLAKVLGINYHTVNAVYKQLEMKGLIKSKRGRHSVVQAYSRALLASKNPIIPTFTLGVLLPEYSPVYAPILKGIENAAQDGPWINFVCVTDHYERHASRYIDQLITKNVDGIIIIHFERPNNPEMIQTMHLSENLPFIVFVDSPGMDGPRVLFNREAGVYDATCHLVDHGHKRIGLITTPLEWSTAKESYKGYERALLSNRLRPESELITTVYDYSIASGYNGAIDLLKIKNPPTSIFINGDRLAIGAAEAIKSLGLTVGRDVAIIGYGEMEYSAYVSPSITTVSLPYQFLGFEAMTLLHKLITDEKADRHTVILDTPLTIRQSCGCNGAL